MTRVCLIGAGSLEWSQIVITDLLAVFPEPMEIRLHDLSAERSRLAARLGKRIAAACGRQDKFRIVADRRKALKGVDGVIISVAVGGLEAMAHDLAIPEKYGIYATVGDTSGPGGWARSIRNIPVFQEFARDFADVCPTAFIANYTNPMASVTAALALECPNPVVGLCHAFFETRDLIQRIFALPDHDSICLSFAGMNHFTWVPEMRIGREDGYAKLRKKLRGGSLGKILFREFSDGLNMPWHLRLCVDLFDTHGYLTLPGDRHTCEFLSYIINAESVPSPESEEDVTTAPMVDLEIARTSIADRRNRVSVRLQQFEELLDGSKKMPTERSRETAADMIRAYLRNKPFTSSMNVLNRGQIPGLPLGTCVETLGTVDGLGPHPCIVDEIPDFLLEMMRTHANCQKWITEGGRTGDSELLLQALYQDPTCAHLQPAVIREMAVELLAANAEYIHPRLRP